MRSAILLDMTRCMACEACLVACKTGNRLPEGRQYIHFTHTEVGTFPDVEVNVDNHRCFHCGDAACVDVCPTGALYKHDGLTRLDREACSGCSYCVQACPYEVPIMSDGRSSKCDACASAVDAGGTPWCVSTCPGGALEYGDRDDIVTEAGARADAVRAGLPNVEVYGEDQAGGLGLVMVLPEGHEAAGLPADPAVAGTLTTAWKHWIQPVSMAATTAAAVGAGVLGIIARRNHLAELREIEAAATPVEAATTSSPGTAEEKEADHD
jgi:formate dehydrogenase iron-sulfur subunit